jgi:hypothetical protein
MAATPTSPKTIRISDQPEPVSTDVCTLEEFIAFSRLLIQGYNRPNYLKIFQNISKFLGGINFQNPIAPT